MHSEKYGGILNNAISLHLTLERFLCSLWLLSPLSMANLDRALPGSQGHFPVTGGKVLSSLSNTYLDVKFARRGTQRGVTLAHFIHHCLQHL